MYMVNIKDKEKYALRLLLLTVKGCKSFEDVRTHNSIVYSTFEEAAISRNLLRNDGEWEKCLDEAVLVTMPKQLRLLFSMILVHGNPINSVNLYEKYKMFLCEDFLRTHNLEISIDLLLQDIQSHLNLENKTLFNYNLPNPLYKSILFDETLIDVENMKKYSENNIKTFNIKQREVFYEIMESVYGASTYKLFYLDGPAGSGKTYLYNTIIAHILGKSDKVLPCASTGIASTLLLNANTYHSTFQLFPPINNTSVCQIKHESDIAKCIINSKLILIDEVTLATNDAMNAIDICLQDLMQNTLPYGGKTILLGK